MAAAEVGRMSVRGVPDTKGFAKELKAQLAKIEKQAKVTIKATLDASDVVSQAKAAAKAASGIATVVVETRIESAKLARQAVAAAREAGAAAKVEIPVELERSGAFRAQVREMVALVERNAAELRIQAETAAARAEAERLAHDIADQQPEMQVGLDTAVAAARIAALTRDRFATIHARVSTSSLAGASTALAALSGLRLANSFSRGVRDMVMNLDQAIPSIAKTVTLLGSLGNVAGSAAGLLLGVGASLSQIVGALAVAPALVMGLGTGFGVLIAALLDTGDVLGDLGPQFTALQDSISGAFWAEGEAGARALVDAFMPLADHWLPQVATELGRLPGMLAAVIGSPVGQGALESIFREATAATKPMIDGIGQFLAGFLRLADAGAKFLPQMANWFADLGTVFDAWANKFTSSGSFDQWVTRAWDNMQALGSVIGSTLGILGAFASAAEAAGSPGLQGLADGLNVVEDALKSPVWQGALTEVFEGWNDGMANMLPGLGALADGFIALSPTIGEISRLAGEAASAVLGGLGAIAENPTFQSGLVDLFVGVRNGLQSVADVAPEIAEKFGKVATLAGQMADTFGDVLATGIREFGPVLSDILDAAAALVPVLGGALIRAFEVIGPAVRPIVAAISEWAQENPGLAASLLAVGAGVGLFVAGLVKLLGFVVPVVNGVSTLSSVLGKVKLPAGGGFGGLGKALGGIARAAKGIGGPLTLVIGLLTAMWTNSEDLRGSVADLVESFLGFAKALGGAVLGALKGVGSALEDLGLMDALKGALGFLGDGAGILGDLAGVLVEWIADSFKVLTAFIEGDTAGVKTALSEMGRDALEGLKGVFVDGMTWVWDLVKMTIGTKLQEIALTVVTWAQGLVAPVIAGLMSIYTSVTGFFSTLGASFTTGLTLVKLAWDLFWTGLVTTVTTWWVSITTALSTVWTSIQGTFMAGVALVRLIWDTFWNGLILTVTTVWASIVAFLTTVWAQIQAAFTAGVALVRLVWDTFWAGLLVTVTTVWAGIVAFLMTAWAQIQAVFQMGITLVQTIWTTMWTTLQTIVTTVWATITAAVQTGIALVQGVISAGVALISSLWSAGWAAVSAAASAAWSTIVSVVSGAVSGLVSVLSGAASTMLSLMSTAWSSIQSAASSAWATIQSTVTTAMAGLVSAITSGAASALTAFQNLATNALSALRTMVTNAASIGSDVVAGIISGVQGAAGGLFSTLRDLASSALDAAKGALGIKSPSRVFRDQVGQWIPAGMAKGISQNTTAATKAASDMAQQAVDQAASQVSTMRSVGDDLGTALADGLRRPVGLLDQLTAKPMRIGVDHEAAAVQSALASMVAPPSQVVPQVEAGAAPGTESDASTGLTREELLAALSGMKLLLDGRELTTGIRESKRRSRDLAPL